MKMYLIEVLLQYITFPIVVTILTLHLLGKAPYKGALYKIGQPSAFLLREMMLTCSLDEQRLGNSSSLSIPCLPQGSHYNQTPETDQGPTQLVFSRQVDKSDVPSRPVVT